MFLNRYFGLLSKYTVTILSLDMIDRIKFFFLKAVSRRLFQGDKVVVTLHDATVDPEWGFLRSKFGWLYADAWGGDRRGLRFIYRRMIKEREQSTFFRDILGWSLTSRRVHVSKALYLVPSSGWTIDQPNYFHWLLETLPGISLYLSDASLRDRKILLRRGSPQWVYDSLEIFGVHREQTLETSEHCQLLVDDLVIPKIFWISAFSMPDSPFLRRMRQQVLSMADQSLMDLVYFARGESDRRRPDNNEEIEQLVTALGGSVYLPAQLTVKQQQEVCSKAHTLVLPTGASVANAIWMPVGAHLVVLEAMDDSRSTFLPQLAVMFELRLSIVESWPSAEGSGRHDNYVSNLTSLRGLLSDRPGDGV